ncbi:MAG: hypothetical protein EOO07_26545 [Chitinophagaceae bacterium]|nr:MAG: hypothetical protein EOO07_26545 [Chitinophagaceae bacterium]
MHYTNYKAYKKGQTATAIIYHSKEMFKGTLEIRYNGTYKDSGDVKGMVKGDTLIGEFHYLAYNLAWKRKPVAFLIKKDRMVMGQGLTKLTVGIPHFNAEVPIDFNEKERFVFYPSQD